MPDVYNIRFESTSDWFKALIQDGAEWVLPPGGTLSVNCVGDQSIESVQVAPKSAGVKKKTYNIAKVTMHLYLQTTSSSLTVKLGHGDYLGNPPDGVTISSPVESKTNNQVLGDGQNYVEYTLRLK
jgi:hypothetical protein